MITIHDSLRFFAHFRDQLHLLGPALELEEKPEIPFSTLLERHLSVLSATDFDFSPHIEGEEIREADEGLSKILQEGIPCYATTGEREMVETAARILKAAKARLENKEPPPSYYETGSAYARDYALPWITTALSYVDPNRAVAVDSLAMIDRLLGPNRPLTEEDSDFLYSACLENPRFGRALHAFLKEAEAAKARNLEFVKEHCYISPHPNLVEKWEPVNTALLPIGKKPLSVQLMEAAVPINDQLLIDGQHIDLLDKRIDRRQLPSLNRYGTMEDRRVMEHYQMPDNESFEDLSRYADECEKRGEAADPSHHRALIDRYGYTSRQGGYTRQKIAWERQELNEKGGFRSAVRMVGFSGTKGPRKEVRVKLDFSPLGNPDMEQSKKMLDLVFGIHEEIHLLRGWIEAARQNPEAPLAVEDRRLNQRLEALNWLDAHQKQQLLKIATNYVFELHQGFTRALLTV